MDRAASGCVRCVIRSLAMWWLYFDTAAEAGSETISHSSDPGKLARLAYTYIHLFIVAGIVVSAVADEFVLAHPLGHSDEKTVVAVLESTAIYLLGNLLFKWTIAGRSPLSHIVAIAPMFLLAFVANHSAPLMLSALATLVLVIVAAWERRAGGHLPESPLSVE